MTSTSDEQPDTAATAQTVDDLDALSTDELRERAFHRAEHHHDVGFFWDLVKHMPASEDAAQDDGSLGGLGEGVVAVMDLATAGLRRHGGELEPLLRARYIDYLSQPA